MKLLLAVLLSMVLSFSHAKAGDNLSPPSTFGSDINVVRKPNLEGGDIVRQAICTQGKKKLLCVAVKKDDKLYVVVVDDKGEYAIYWISPTGNVFLWGRDLI